MTSTAFRRLTSAPLVAALLLAVAPGAAAQFFAFGQNKIQYRKLDWRVVRGAHIDLYYYPAEAELAPAALAYAEASYDTLAIQFGHEVAELDRQRIVELASAYTSAPASCGEIAMCAPRTTRQSSLRY